MPIEACNVILLALLHYPGNSSSTASHIHSYTTSTMQALSLSLKAGKNRRLSLFHCHTLAAECMHAEQGQMDLVGIRSCQAHDPQIMSCCHRFPECTPSDTCDGLSVSGCDMITVIDGYCHQRSCSRAPYENNLLTDVSYHFDWLDWVLCWPWKWASQPRIGLCLGRLQVESHDE